MKFILLTISSFLLLSAFMYRNKHALKPKLTCVITTTKTVYKLGEIPDIKVNIVNKSKEDVYLIGSLDGSDVQMRMPYCYFTIVKPTEADTPYISMRCGNTNPLEPEDFRLVKPGQAFNPYENIGAPRYFPSDEITDKWTFKNPGTYKIQFHYSTNSSDLAKFLGTPDYLKDIKDSIKIAAFFPGVPKVDISSNILELTVVQ